MLNNREQFFYDHAGYSYDPKTQTPEQGRRYCAAVLASAELWASEQGFSFRWERDDLIDSSEFDDSPEPWGLWQCLMHDTDGEIIGSLHGIDFGRDGSPWADPYRRVVEAEMAVEARHEISAA